MATFAEKRASGQPFRTPEEAVAGELAFSTSSLPEPISDDEKQFEGSPVGRGLQGALIQSAFQKFGEAFHGGGYTPPGQQAAESPGIAAWRAQGAQVAAALENRWHMAEFANFRKQQLARFQKDAEAVRQESQFRNAQLNRGHWYEPDGSLTKLDPNTPEGREQIALFRGQLQADVINKIGQLQVALGNEAAEKYSTNPLVGQVIQNMYEKATKAMMTQFQPKETLDAEQQRADIRSTEADVALKTQQTATSAAMAADAQTAAKEPRSLPEAYALGGAGALDEFINGTKNGLDMWGAVREGYRAQANAAFDARFIKAHPELANDEARMTMALERAKIENDSRLEKLAQWQWVSSTLGPEAAKEFSAANPGYGPDPAGPTEPAIKGRISPKETKAKTKEWGGIALEVYRDYISQADDKDAALEYGIDYVLNEWLPERLSGEGTGEEYDDYINSNLSASGGQATAAYREQVRAFIEATLRKHAGANAPELPPEARVKRPTQQRRGHKQAGALGRGIQALFGDQPPEAPKLTE